MFRKRGTDGSHLHRSQSVRQNDEPLLLLQIRRLSSPLFVSLDAQDADEVHSMQEVVESALFLPSCHDRKELVKIPLHESLFLPLQTSHQDHVLGHQ